MKLLKEVEGKNIPMTESMVSDALYTICYGAAPAQAAKGQQTTHAGHPHLFQLCAPLPRHLNTSSPT